MCNTLLFTVDEIRISRKINYMENRFSMNWAFNEMSRPCK